MTHDDLVDRANITDHILKYATGIDQHQWDLYRSIYADEATLDFSSWSGTPASTMPADDWVAGVRATLEPFDATQHVLTNFVLDVNGDSATCTCYMSAHHHLVVDGDRQMHSIGGYYVHELGRVKNGWLIHKTTLNVTWEMGDRGLFDLAAKRGAKKMV
ncbi:nuclear transport factor 2 family protein [Parasphingorhabdus sp. JC815]|uniref:nuclear transport factor 2 family protein n=1 Tax=Parasphingorhabdus sp. JC815 TaxID=3232140 RepID=UPI0034590883